MLYEVITPLDYRQQDVVSEIQRLTGVITSYSIHYTKLYDIPFRKDGWKFATASIGQYLI